MFEWLFGPSYPTLQTVIANTKDGKAFRGVIWARRGGYLVLRNAQLLRAKGETVPLDGEVLVPERDVEFLQVLQGVSL